MTAAAIAGGHRERGRVTYEADHNLQDQASHQFPGMLTLGQDSLNYLLYVSAGTGSHVLVPALL